eukprot:gene67410-92341_t
MHKSRANVRIGREIMQLDRIDAAILKLVALDARASVSQIAEQVGLSHTPCWRRMKRLEESGVVRGRALLLEPSLVDLDVTVF